MNQSEFIQSSLSYDVVLKIASSLQVRDLCALGCCSRFWKDLCGSDFIWESLARDRWPSLGLFAESSSSSRISNPTDSDSISMGWRGFYIARHYEIACGATIVGKFLEQCCMYESIEVGDYLKAIENLCSMQFGFRDVQMFLFKPKLNVLLNLVGVHYCINFLGVPAEYVMKELQSCNISERQVSVRWWKLGRWFYGFRMRDESHSRRVSLGDLAMEKEEEVLGVLHRGALHEVFRVQISIANPTCTPWSYQSTQVQH